ncbi:hypothetical protein COV19_03140 [Candidatus Woesearchaeota archaeon CG10_big_fil_rev_8_21_14_0_10_44_13]|nr:MAG: hypothetical protein COV19_03140 [Candidatus Woesearchaeota archaeon CG10_big_fil_rev_8_21_14_0_10_44_13]
MVGLSDSQVYERALAYWPYKDSLRKVIDHICVNAPIDRSLLDLMCGPGYLLGQVAARRKDLSLKGVDLDSMNIAHSKREYPGIDFEVGDVLLWKPDHLFDVVACTGALHHIQYGRQEEAIEGIASMVKPGGIVIISDSYIADYSNETERKAAAAKLGQEYLGETIQNGAPEPVIEATMQILWNDVLMKEFKTSMNRRLPIFKKIFSHVKTLKTWPEFESEYGDYISVCRKSHGA